MRLREGYSIQDVSITKGRMTEIRKATQYIRILVPVRTSFGLRRHSGTTWNVSAYSKVDLDMLNAVKIKLADVSSVSPSSKQSLCSDEGLTLETSANL